jgi:putative ABC transport system ATP-binding protein
MNLEIKKGEFIVIMNQSDSGKSTLLNVIGALDKADEVSIKVSDIDLMTAKDHQSSWL